MRRDITRFVTLLTAAVVMWGCSPKLYQPATFASDDMYAPHDIIQIEKKEANAQLAAQRLSESRMAQWARILGLEVDELARKSDAYNTTYGEKLRALSADKYERPASYHQYEYQQALEELAQYDPAEYNASINSAGEVEISPKYMSSIYGVWSTPYYSDFAWAYGYPSWSYYSTWGYPVNSWMSWNYSFGYYNPWWGAYPYYPYPSYGYGYGWYNPYYAPMPIYYGGGGAKRPIVRQASHHSAATGARRADGSTVGRSSSNSYNRSAVKRTSPSYQTPTRTPAPTYAAPSSISRPPVRLNSIGR